MVYEILTVLFDCTVHAAVVAINQAIDLQDEARTLTALQEPNACLVDIFPDLAKDYQLALFRAKSEKATQAQGQVLNVIVKFSVPCKDDLFCRIVEMTHVQKDLLKLAQIFTILSLRFLRRYIKHLRVFHHISKHLEVRQKYSAAHRIFNSLLGVRCITRTSWTSKNAKSVMKLI